MKRSLLVAVIFALSTAAVCILVGAQNIPGKAYSCPCYCGKVLSPPCSDNACKQACGYREPSSGNSSSSSSYDYEAERQRQRELEAERERQRQREIEEQRRRDEEKARREKEEFERKKQDALNGMKGLGGGELGLKGGNDNLGLKDLSGNDSGGLGLKDISNSNSQGARLTPGALQNIPVRILERRQPEVMEVNRKIRQAQEALRRLIRSNGQSEDQRLEWTADSLDASEDAEKLSLTLVLDLIGAHVDYLAKVNKEERAQALNQLLSRTQAQSQEKGLHTIYGMLINRKEELERIQNEVMLADKTNNLHEKLADLKKANNSEFTREDMYEIVTQIKDAVGVVTHKEFPAAVNLAGPAKDLLDSAYVIWKQAASMSRLSQIQGEQEKSLQAANSLRQYILKLEKQKQTASAGATGQVPTKPR